ncbi:MAG: hypothetical protein QNL55_02035 [Euryarchaeota archaeon]
MSCCDDPHPTKDSLEIDSDGDVIATCRKCGADIYTALWNIAEHFTWLEA